jgi:hypothetical protein
MKASQQVVKRFLDLTAAQRAGWVGSIRTYVTNDQVVNLIANLDINDADPKRASKSTNIFFIVGQLIAFDADPTTAAQITAWSTSPA